MPNFDHYFRPKRAHPQPDPFLTDYPSVTRRELETLKGRHARAAVAAGPIHRPRWPFSNNLSRAGTDETSRPMPAHWPGAVAVAALLLGAILHAGGLLP